MGYKDVKRGYFGIGIYCPKNRHNIGTLWRSANILGASFIYTIGKRYKQQSTDTLKTHRHIPLYNYENFDDFYQHLPYACQVVAIEITPKACPLQEFPHPERAAYLLGAEDHGLPENLIEQTHQSVFLQVDGCMNVAVAGSIILYDRYIRGFQN